MELADKDSFYNNNVIKYSYHLSDTSKNSNKDKKTNNKPKFKGKKLKINSVSELEFLYNDSQNRATSKNKNMKIKKKNLINYTSNDKNSTSIMSPKNDSINKNSRQYQQFNLKKSSQSSIDIFWESVKQYEQYKNDKINNLKTEIMNQELSEIRKIPKILKRSIIIANAKGKDPLYLQRPLSEEKMLEKDFLKFYKRNLKFTNKVHSKLINEKRLQEKYSKIYEDNIQWKKNKEEKNNKTRYEYNKMIENDINKKLTFRPLLTQNTLQIVQKLKKNKKINLNKYNNLYNFENERELLDKLKLKLKPVLSEYFDINNTKRPYIGKKSLYIANNLTENNKRKPMSRAKSYQIIPNQNKRISKPNIENKKINLVKKEENKDDTLNENNKIDIYNCSREKKHEYYLEQKLKEMKKPKAKKKDKKELYKLNIRQTTAWNQDFINNNIPKKKFGRIIKGLL